MEKKTTCTQTKYGWRVKEWGEATGLHRAFIFTLIDAEEIESVKVHGARVILTHPFEFLQRHKAEAAL